MSQLGIKAKVCEGVLNKQAKEKENK